jgi:peptidoglycan/LPS O-acetylase OafA/YrhL
MGAVLLDLAVWSRRPFGVWQRGLAWLGICSYSFYLWHQPVLPLLVKGLRLGGPHYAGAQLVILFVVALGVISLLSFGLYRAVERPSQQLGKRASRPRQREYALELASAPEGISSSSVS